MVARFNRELFARAFHMPKPNVLDSEDVRLALETARELVAQEEIRGAAQALRRAADAAAKQGNDERVRAMERAAADLTNAIVSAKENDTAPSSVPTLNVRGRNSMRATRQEPAAKRRAESSPLSSASPAASPPSSVPPMLAALVSSIPPFSTRRSSSRPPSAAQETAAAPAISARPVNALVSTPASKPVTERTMRIGAIRVAIKSLILDAKSFSVERLKKGQRVPDGMTEAMLVVTRAIGGSIDWETNLRLTEGSATRTSSPPANPAPVRYVSKPSRPPEKPTAEGAMCAATIRVSIAGSIGDATSFTVERFDAGGPLPAGTMEGMLVLTGGIEGSIQIETHVPVPTA